MFYKINPTNPADRPERLTHDPFKAILVPRPIGWISTADKDGKPNLAPYSFYNGIAGDPPMVMFAPSAKPGGEAKDSLRNCRETGEFMVNFATESLADAMNASSVTAPHGFDEFAFAKLTLEPGDSINAPRVAESPMHLECLVHDIIALPDAHDGTSNDMVLGKVIGIHIQDDVLDNKGLIDLKKLRPLARLGYMDYTVVDNFFRLDRPPSLT